MEKVSSLIEKGISTLTNISENSQPKSLQKRIKKPELPWLPVQFDNFYFSTDLTYSFCVELFGHLEAAKRDDIPETTMRQWFMEFIRAGWTKEMVKNRYDGVLRTQKFGAIDFSDWVRAVPVYAEDEIRLMVKQRVEAMITKGRFLKDKKIELTEDDKKAIDLAIAKEIEFDKTNELRRSRDDYREERINQLRAERRKEKK